MRACVDALASARDDRRAPQSGDGAVLRCGRLDGAGRVGGSGGDAGVLARYFERMKRIVESHGGSVEKFIGDAVMAVFGVPVAHEDDALRESTRDPSI
jgi:class 3 adenylate cyclase